MSTNVKPVTSVTSNLDQLVQLLQDSQSLEQSHKIIKQSTIVLEDVERYRYFNKTSYGRNLVYSCEKFEIILMCWKPSQESAIHDHAQSDCIMRCVSGMFEEELYHIAPSAKIEFDRSHIMRAGDVSYINNDMGLHKIKNINNGESLALHFYFPGINQFFIFNEHEATRKEVQSSFTSKYGEL